jgi:hypothetical protein
MTRYIHTEIQDPAISSLRKPKRAIIPPFSFPGEMEVVTTGFWSPTATINLLSANITASTGGIANLDIIMFKKVPFVSDPVVVFGFTLGASQTSKWQKLNNKILYPTDRLFAVGFSDSEHQNVVIQMVGDVVTGL